MLAGMQQARPERIRIRSECPDDRCNFHEIRTGADHTENQNKTQQDHGYDQNFAVYQDKQKGQEAIQDQQGKEHLMKKDPMP